MFSSPRRRPASLYSPFDFDDDAVSSPLQSPEDFDDMSLPDLVHSPTSSPTSTICESPFLPSKRSSIISIVDSESDTPSDDEGYFPYQRRQSYPAPWNARDEMGTREDADVAEVVPERECRFVFDTPCTPLSPSSSLSSLEGAYYGDCDSDEEEDDSQIILLYAEHPLYRAPSPEPVRFSRRLDTPDSSLRPKSVFADDIDHAMRLIALEAVRREMESPEVSSTEVECSSRPSLLKDRDLDSLVDAQEAYREAWWKVVRARTPFIHRKLILPAVPVDLVDEDGEDLDNWEQDTGYVARRADTQLVEAPASL